MTSVLFMWACSEILPVVSFRNRFFSEFTGLCVSVMLSTTLSMFLGVPRKT